MTLPGRILIEVRQTRGCFSLRRSEEAITEIFEELSEEVDAETTRPLMRPTSNKEDNFCFCGQIHIRTQTVERTQTVDVIRVRLSSGMAVGVGEYTCAASTNDEGG
eukprot:Selendium_serpulae@DN6450_c2_g9_i2.p1